MRRHALSADKGEWLDRSEDEVNLLVARTLTQSVAPAIRPHSIWIHFLRTTHLQ